MVSSSASELVMAGAFRGAELRRAREQGLRKNSTRITNIARERNRMMGVFKSFDLDGDGILTADEFACALRRVNPELRNSQVREFSRHINKERDGGIAWPEFCEKLSVAAETCRAHAPSFLKGTRWVDNGDIIGNTDDDARKLVDAAVPIDFNTTSRALLVARAPYSAPAAGTQSEHVDSAERNQVLFDEWDARNMARRGRGVSTFQSGGLRFDDRGFQTSSVGRGAAQPAAHHRTVGHRGMLSSAVRECLQPEVPTPRPSTAAADVRPQSRDRVFHLRQCPPVPTARATNALH
ncbi:hypothetical protein KFE25_006433 [Diacronema lutheri]|uniref:EF-hand domain-containing protein n=1 Tax=Diacronema lutheri TaxID=2081491 RepID=A0A8J5XQT4_DIALT|nr:hypothetical protein KFE25_006433 [Diacronema lutheri]